MFKMVTLNGPKIIAMNCLVNNHIKVKVMYAVKTQHILVINTDGIP